MMEATFLWIEPDEEASVWEGGPGPGMTGGAKPKCFEFSPHVLARPPLLRFIVCKYNICGNL